MSMKHTVSVPFFNPGIPCASLPIYFAYDFSYNARYFGFFITCLYSIISPVSWFRTAFIISVGNLRCANFRGVICSCMTLMQASIVSCAMERVWLLFCRDGPFILAADFSCRISSATSRFATCSASLGDRRGGCTLGGVAGRNRAVIAAVVRWGGLNLGVWTGCVLVFGAAFAGTLGGVGDVVGGRISNVGLDNVCGTGWPMLAAIRADRRLVWMAFCYVVCFFFVRLPILI